MLTTTIAGVDRSTLILAETYDIQSQLGSRRDTASFVLESGDGSVAAQVGQAVIITNEAGTRLFGGRISTAPPTAQGPVAMRYDVTCVDWSDDLTHKLANDEYTNKTCRYIIEDLLTKYASGDGFTTVNVQDGPVIKKIKFPYKDLTWCLDRLAAVAGGYGWYPDSMKDIHFFARETDYAPITITATSKNYIDMRVDPDRSQLVNKVTLRGGNYVAAAITEHLTGDGRKRVFPLGYKPKSVTISVAGGPAITPGVDNLDDEGSFTWLMNHQEKFVRVAAATATPADAVTIDVTYSPVIPLLVQQTDDASIAETAAREGDDGIREIIIVDETITSLEAAQARVEAVLAVRSKVAMTGTFMTRETGLKAGQLISIELPKFGLSGWYMIQAVAMRYLGDLNRYVYEVQFGDRPDDIVDFFASLLDVQAEPGIDIDEVLQKIQTVGDSAQLDDAGGLVTEVRDPTTFRWGGLHFLRGSFSRNSDAYDRVTGQKVLPSLGRFEPGPWAGVSAWLGEEPVTNLLTANQASVETDTTGFLANNLSTISRDTTQKRQGVASLRCVTPGSGLSEGFILPFSGLTASQTYTASVYVLAPSGANLRMLFQERDGSDVLVDTATTYFTGTGIWQRVTATNAFGATGVKAKIFVETTSTAQAITFWYDCGQLEQKSYATSWQLPGTARSPEPLAIPISAAVLPLTGFTWEQVSYIDAMARRQVAGSMAIPFVIPRLGALNGITMYHDPGSANWFFEVVNDAGVGAAAVIPDSYTPDGFARFRAVVSPAEAKLLINGVVRGSITNPSLPTALGSLAYVGSQNGINHFANTLHCDIRASNIARADGVDEGLTGPLAVDANTTAKLDLNGSFENTGLIQPGWKWGRGEYRRTA
ncbi:MAG: hypothetical protein ACYC9Q_14140 [Bacillota bacterium]